MNTTISDSTNDIKVAMVQGRKEIMQEIQKVPEAFSKALAKQLGPSLDELNETVKELRKEKDESSTEAITKLVEEFKNALSGSFTKEIETLVKELSTVSQSLINLPTRMEDMMEGVLNKINEICDSLKIATVDQTKLTEETIKEILDGLQSAITELNSTIDSITSKAATESFDMIKQIRKSVNETTERLNNIFEKGEESIRILLDKQGELIKAIDTPISKSQETLEKGNNLLEKMNTSLNTTNDMIVTMQAFSDQLKGSAATLKTAGENLTEASNAFNQHNTEYLAANRDTNQQIQKSLQQSQQLLNEFANKFEKIESGLQDIFKEINKGLIEYSTTTHDSMGKSLGEFSKHLADAADALAGSVSALKISVEELSDMIEQCSRLRSGR